MKAREARRQRHAGTDHSCRCQAAPLRFRITSRCAQVGLTISSAVVVNPNVHLSRAFRVPPGYAVTAVASHRTAVLTEFAMKHSSCALWCMA